MYFIIVHFDYPNRKGMYATLYDVLAKSISINVPDATIIHKDMPSPKVKNKVCFSSNNYKLKIWLDELTKLPEDAHVLFLDADMLVLQDPSKAFDMTFDIAYTVRPSKKPPVNGGAVYIKNNERSRAFIKKWQAVDDKMFNNKSLHMQYRKKYAGMNQASFGYMLEHAKEYSAKLIPIPCAKWNCCNETWRSINADTHIVHIKGPLRRACLSGRIAHAYYRHAVHLWHEYYQKLGKKMQIKEGLMPSTSKKKSGPLRKFRPVPQLPPSSVSRNTLNNFRGKRNDLSRSG